MIELPESGYTPENLKALRIQCNLTQKHVAEITNTKQWRTVARWEAEVDAATHSDMPLKKWQVLYNYACELKNSVQ